MLATGVRVEKGGESVKDERRAEDSADVRGIGEARDNFCVKDAEDQSGDGDDEADKWAGGAHVEKSAARANRRTNHDKGAEGADEGWKRNEERVGGMDVMVAAGEVVAEFVDEQDGEKRESEGQAADECYGMFVKERQRVYKFVEVDGFVFGVGGCEVGAGDEAGAEGDEEEKDCDEECS
jgi:hypothetical protein